jgi:hypothetical protein
MDRQAARAARAAEIQARQQANAARIARRRELTDAYHAPGVCEENFPTLVANLNILIAEGRLNAAIEQLRRCAEGRKRLNDESQADRGHILPVLAIQRTADYLTTLGSDPSVAVTSIKIAFSGNVRDQVFTVTHDSLPGTRSSTGSSSRDIQAPRSNTAGRRKTMRRRRHSTHRTKR